MTRLSAKSVVVSVRIGRGAVAFLLVGTEKRKEPVNAYVGVDLLDCGDTLWGQLKLLCEIPLDHTKGAYVPPDFSAFLALSHDGT